MPSQRRPLFDAACAVSLFLMLVCLLFAAPDRTTYPVTLQYTFNPMAGGQPVPPPDALNVRRKLNPVTSEIRYDYDLPGPDFGARFVPLPGGRIGLVPALLLAAALPVIWLWRTLRAPETSALVRRLLNLPTHGHCHVCHYDLRATPDPYGPLYDRCPECGTPSPESRWRRPAHFPLPPRALKPARHT